MIRTVNVNPDSIVPVITLIGAASVSLNLGDTYIEQGATASDNIDGDITANIIIGGNVIDTNTEGSYLVTYNVSDTAGNNAAQVTRTITVINPNVGPITIHQAYFETGWDNWIDGGSDCARVQSSNSYEGNFSIQIRDNSGVASSMTSPTFNLSSYNEVVFDFYFYSSALQTGEDFWLQYNNGSGFVTIKTWALGTDFNNNAFGNFTVTLNASQYNLSNNARFRLVCDASANNDQIFIDQIVITGIEANNALFKSSIVEKVLDVKDNIIIKNVLTVFPNPVNGDILNIKTSKGEKLSYIIINALGQIVHTGETIKEISVDNLEAGMYFIEVTEGADKMMKRFIKQ